MGLWGERRATGASTWKLGRQKATLRSAFCRRLIGVLGSGNLNMNDFVLDILKEALLKDENFLEYLNRAIEISRFTKNWYGFEWLFHTTIACYLISKKDEKGITNLAVGGVNNKNQKPDMSFHYNGHSVFIELKTISGNSFSLCKNDIAKLSSYSGLKYVAVCCYRNRKDRAEANLVGQFIINDKFRVVLLRT